jgi:hypothetical protein
MQQAIDHLCEQLPNLHIYEWGESETGAPQTVHYFIRKGSFAGLLVTPGHALPDREEILPQLEPVSDNDYIKAMLFRFAEQHPKQAETW